VVPHPSTGHAHGCLASEIGRDPAFPTRYDRTVASLEVSLLAPSQTGKGLWIIKEGVELSRNKNSKTEIDGVTYIKYPEINRLERE
tara:strand:- start:444 stop:701 length:258 start_codon:yes stop_codon:yes gene_type:complete